MKNIAKSKSACPTGTGMHNLKGAKNRHFRREFWKLPAEKQEKVKQLAARYYDACDREGVSADSEFFSEVIVDVRDEKFQ